MSKRTKVLLIVLAVLVVAAGVLWFLTKDKGVSADVNGTTGESASDGLFDASIVQIDDELTTVSAGQIVNYSITVDTLKMFERVSGITNPTEAQFNTWNAAHVYDKYFVLAFLATGRSAANNSWIVTTPNFTIQMPDLKYPLVQVKYSAAATAPNNIDLVGNELVNIARIVRRPCTMATRPTSLFSRYLSCRLSDKVLITQNKDTDRISFDNNTTNLSLTSFTTADDEVFMGEVAQFTAKYRNRGPKIAGATKLKIRFKENSFKINDPSFTQAPKETIDGVKYDVYMLALGDVMPTVNGTTRTDAATIAAIKTALNAALTGNTNTELVAEINKAIAIVDQYAAGTKTIAELVTALNSVKTVMDREVIQTANDIRIDGIIAKIRASITSLVLPRQDGSKPVYEKALSIAIEYKNGTKTKSDLQNQIALLRNLAAGNSIPGFHYWTINAEVVLLTDRNKPVGFGASTVTAIAQAVSSGNSLATSANTPAEDITIPFSAQSLAQSPGIYRFEVTAELITSSTDSNPTDNKYTLPMGVWVPTN